MALPGLAKVAPGKMTALFLVAGSVTAVALVWMGVHLLEQDRALEAQRLEEQRDAVADRVVAALEQALLAEERGLTVTSPQTAGEDILVVTAGPAEFHVRPERSILYYPMVSPAHDASPELFVAAERFEFLDHEYERAVAAFRALSASRDPAVKAGAQVRLARNLRKAGRPDAALGVYDELKRSGATVTGVPAGLVARRARCVLLGELGRTDQLRVEARELQEHLSGAQWRLDRDTYLYYSSQASGWAGSDSASGEGNMALTRAADWLWQHWQPSASSEVDSAGRRSLRFDGMPVAVLWRASGGRLTGLIAGPKYQRHRWFDPVLGDPGFGGVRIRLLDTVGAIVYGVEPRAGLPETSRSVSATALPWDIVVTTTDFEKAMGSFVQRRRLMTAGLVAAALLVIATSYFIARAVSRELAAARLQSDFVSAVSHEFRTPLTSMRQFTEMLVEDDNLPPEKRRSFYSAQERATRRLSRLVESLLDFGRMEAGARPYRLEPLDAGHLVRTVVEEFRQEPLSGGFVVDCALPDEQVIVNADREALAQAIWNLLDNAVKYSGDSRTVRVEVEGGGHVAIRVRDEGYGIPLSERSRILRKFSRGSAAKSHGIKGTGIGLAMVKHIVAAHGGKLLIESEPGKGSRFTIRLPAGG